MYVCSTTIRRRRETRPSTVAWNNPLTEAHVLPHSETWRLQWRLKFLFSFLLVGGQEDVLHGVVGKRQEWEHDTVFQRT